MKMLDTRHPMFRPLWVRVLVTGLCLGWAVFEFVAASPFWGVLFGSAGLWCLWQFFIVFDPADYQRKDREEP